MDRSQMSQKVIIDLARLNSLNAEGCPACNRKFVLGDTVVAACGNWQGGMKWIHASEAIFDRNTATYVERQCFLSNRTPSDRYG